MSDVSLLRSDDVEVTMSLEHAALAAALEALGAPAFVIDDAGGVLHANDAGHRAHRERPDLMAADLRRAPQTIGSAFARFNMTRISFGGTRGHFLAVMNGAAAQDARVERAARVMRLTARQRDVLRHLVVGHSNKHIASELSCSPGTIELHVSAILKKAGVISRAEVVAKFWRHEF